MLTAASLSRGLLPEPHLGEWMQEGQPSSQGQAAVTSRAAAQQVFQDLEGPDRQAHAAGVAVVDEDGGPAHLGVRRMGDAADVVAVRQGKERKHADEDVLQGVDAAHEVAPGGVNGVFDGVGDLQPHAHGFEDLGRQLQGHRRPEAPGPGRRRFS